jgi:glycosyltransferase involved in cell wall biosynthesis
MSVTLHLAANQGLMGGGEVMLVRCAEVVRGLGLDVVVVAPASPAETLEAARDAGLATVAIPGATRAAYARALRRWDRRRAGVLWCHGLLPAAATTGHRDRIVHLHQLPVGRAQRVLYAASRARARAVLVPSQFVAERLPGTRVLPNWTEEVTVEPPAPPGPPLRPVPTVGLLGRLGSDKGADVLADAVLELVERQGREVCLLLAGDTRFVPDDQARRVEAAVLRLGSRVEVRPWIDRREFFSSVDVAVVPSRVEEAFGLTLAEAMSARVPVVVSDAGALPEVVGPGHPWVARAGDAGDLARVVAAVLDGDRSAAVAAARRRWEQHYSPAAGTADVAALLRDLGLLTAGVGS